MKAQRETFNRLLQLGEDYETAKFAFSAAERGAKAIREAVAARIEADKKQASERVDELESLIADGSRPASARRVWEMELDRLKGRTFSATPDERAAFNGEMAAAQEAVEDLGRLQREIREAIQTVNKAVAELRAQTLGDPNTGLWGNWIESDRKSFAALCQEVGA